MAGVALRRELAFLGDYEVNQTGVVPVLNPQRSVFREGLWAALRLSRMPAEARAVLEFDLGFARHEGAEQVEFRPGLPLVLPRWSELAAEGSCVVTGARTLVLAAVQDTDGAGDGRALVITAEVGALPPALAPPDEAVVLRRYAWGALDRPRRDAADSGLSLDEGGPWSSDQRRERIAEALPGAVDAK